MCILLFQWGFERSCRLALMPVKEKKKERTQIGFKICKTNPKKKKKKEKRREKKRNERKENVGVN